MIGPETANEAEIQAMENELIEELSLDDASDDGMPEEGIDDDDGESDEVPDIEDLN